MSCVVCGGTGLLLQDKCPLCDGVVGWPYCEGLTELTIFGSEGAPIMTVDARKCVELKTIKALRRHLQAAEIKKRRVVTCTMMLEDTLLEDEEILGCGRLCGSQELQAIFHPCMSKARRLLDSVTRCEPCSIELTGSEIIAACITLEESDQSVDRVFVGRLIPILAKWLLSEDSSLRVMRIAASFAIRRLKQSRGAYLPALVSALDDDSRMVRYEVVKTLHDIVKDERRPADSKAAKELILAKSPGVPEDECSGVRLRLCQLYGAMGALTPADSEKDMGKPLHLIGRSNSLWLEDNSP